MSVVVVVVIVVTISNSVDVYNSFGMSLWVCLTHNGCVSLIVGVSYSLWVFHSLWVCLIHCGCVSFIVGVPHLLWTPLYYYGIVHYPYSSCGGFTWVCLTHCVCTSVFIHVVRTKWENKSNKLWKYLDLSFTIPHFFKVLFCFWKGSKTTNS